jgi:cephalosporin hydroxylase
LRAAGPAARALDLACNEGWFCHRLLEWGAAEVVGIDIREKNVRRAELMRDHLGVPAERLRLVRGDVLQSAPEQYGTFDVVLLLGLVYHVEDPIGAMRRAAALTRRLCVVESQLTRQTDPIEFGYGSTGTLLRSSAGFAMLVEPDRETDSLAAREGVASLVPNRAALEAGARVAGFPRVDRAEPREGHNPQYVDGDRAVILAWADADLAPPATGAEPASPGFAEPVPLGGRPAGGAAGDDLGEGRVDAEPADARAALRSVLRSGARSLAEPLRAAATRVRPPRHVRRSRERPARPPDAPAAAIEDGLAAGAYRGAAIERRLDEPLRDYWRDRVERHFLDSYAGVPMTKFPEDLRVYEHLIWHSRANVVVEIGAGLGGSALWFRDRLAALGRYAPFGEPLVVSVDVEPGPAAERVAAVDPSHERTIAFLRGDVRDPGLVERVRARIPRGSRCMVVEDSAHTEATTSAALRGFAGLVPVGGFFVVEDGCVDVEEMRLAPDWPRGVLPAIEDWLGTEAGSRFAVRRDLELYCLSCHPGGFLQRIS